jgi:hypothetical protein
MEEHHRALDANVGPAIAVVNRWAAMTAAQGVQAGGGRFAEDASDLLQSSSYLPALLFTGCFMIWERQINSESLTAPSTV